MLAWPTRIGPKRTSYVNRSPTLNARGGTGGGDGGGATVAAGGGAAAVAVSGGALSGAVATIVDPLAAVVGRVEVAGVACGNAGRGV
jgi:hypothetical protein